MLEQPSYLPFSMTLVQFFNITKKLQGFKEKETQNIKIIWIITLCWPKSSFRFLCKILGSKLFGQPNTNSISKTRKKKNCLKYNHSWSHMNKHTYVHSSTHTSISWGPLVPTCHKGTTTLNSSGSPKRHGLLYTGIPLIWLHALSTCFFTVKLEENWNYKWMCWGLTQSQKKILKGIVVMVAVAVTVVAAMTITAYR